MLYRRRAWEVVEAARTGDALSKVFDVFILVLIVLNIVAVIVETVQSAAARFGGILRLFEVFSVAVFTLEYGLRVWSCVEDERYRSPVRGRIRFILQAMSLVDLLAFLPFYMPFWRMDLRSMRVLRMMRILRVAKIARYYTALGVIKNVFVSQKEELVLTSTVMVMLLVIASSLMYTCENAVQPEAFSSIPATMWWAVATLTTVGYGDITPVTVHGKVLGAVIAVLGIGMFALPAGILGAGFMDEIQKSKKKRLCPHCGESLD